MISLYLKDEEFFHDIFNLIKAFWPGEEVKTVVNDKDLADYYKIVFADGSEMEGQVWFEAEETNRKKRKDTLKKQLYERLCKETGKTLPWGTLTGIRPTKIVMDMMEQKREQEEITAHMKDTYYTSDEKIRLSIEIASREKKLLSGIDYQNGYSLYIGIPFCPTRCLYCSFTSYPVEKWQEETGRYLEAVMKEIDFISQIYQGKKLNTIYIGGGTPTTLKASQLAELLKRIRTILPMEHVTEFTVEAGRPDSVDAEKLQVLKQNGVTRISVNPQTMNQKTLDLIGRRHSVEQVEEAFLLARQIGFDNINMDLITGLPGEGVEEVRHTLKAVGMLAPDSITVHSLAIKRAAGLKQSQAAYTMENTAEIMDLAAQSARQMKLLPYYLYRQKNIAGNYENVGYAKVDKAGIYNILIMEEKQTILAVGAGASSKIVDQESKAITRIENVKDPGLYINRIEDMMARKHKALQQ